MKKTASVLITIPFKNKSELVLSCLESLTKSYISGISYEILLISDGSEEKEIDFILNNNPYRNVNQLWRQSNIGYTKTVFNIMEYAKERGFNFLLISNNDIKFFPGTISSLVRRALSNPNIANVGCKVIHWTDDIIIHTGTRIKNGKISDPYCGLKMNDPITNNVERRLWNNGCCSLFNVQILKKENMNFDLEFVPAYFEESDLMTRLNLKGYSVLYEPRAMVRHLVNGTTRDEPNIGSIFEKNWKLYLSKWEKHFNSKMLYFQ